MFVFRLYETGICWQREGAWEYEILKLWERKRNKQNLGGGEMLLESRRRGWLWEEKRPLPLRETGKEWGITWLRQRGGWRGFTSILSYPLEQGVRPCTQEYPVCEAGLTWGQSWGTCVREMTRDKGRGDKAAVRSEDSFHMVVSFPGKLLTFQTQLKCFLLWLTQVETELMGVILPPPPDLQPLWNYLPCCISSIFHLSAPSVLKLLRGHYSFLYT